MSKTQNNVLSLEEDPAKTAKLAEALKTVFGLGGGERVSDRQFDLLFPRPVRVLSRRHWTPIPVAIRALELLETDSSTRVLDVGSGVGKFCLVASLTGEGKFTGIEQRKSLFDVAVNCANLLGASRASFIHGNLDTLDWSQFDAFYLYNPFYEHVEPTALIDKNITIGEEHFTYYVKVVENKLRGLPVGTRVAIFHGFGGTLPSNYQRTAKEPFHGDYLELWVKESPS